MRAQLLEQGVDEETSTKILSVMACRGLQELEQQLGECDALTDLKDLFAMANGYGFDSWLECDASVVRGLAYYTGAPPNSSHGLLLYMRETSTALFSSRVAICGVHVSRRKVVGSTRHAALEASRQNLAVVLCAYYRKMLKAIFYPKQLYAIFSSHELQNSPPVLCVWLCPVRLFDVATPYRSCAASKPELHTAHH